FAPSAQPEPASIRFFDSPHHAIPLGADAAAAAYWTLEGTVVTTSPEKLQSSATWRRVEEEFLASGSAAGVLSALTDATDRIIRDAYAAHIAPGLPQVAAMLSIGAYGRRQTFPYAG